MPPQSDQLLKRVATRQRLVSLGRWTYRALLVLAGVYALLLVLAKLLGLLPPEWFAVWTVALVPAAAILAGLALHRGINAPQAAHLVDQRMATKDLYLTTSTIDNASGEFKPLVTQAAEAQASRIRPAGVVPFKAWEKATHVVVALAVLFAAAAWMPNFDPFGREEDRNRVAQQLNDLRTQKEQAAKRAKVLRSQKLDAKTSREVEHQLEQLKQTFNQMKKNDPTFNRRRLLEQQKMLGDKWRQVSQQNLKNTKRDKLAQKLGGADLKKTENWRKQLQEGKADDLKKEFDQVKKLAQKIADETNELKKQDMQQKLQKKLQDLAEFARNNASSKELNESLAKAMEQLSKADKQELSKEAMEALKQSSELSKLEMEKLAQSIRDQKSLEEALKAIQNAKQANDKQPLDGQASKDCKSMEQYAELYRKLMGDQLAKGQGQGTSGGEGNQPGEFGQQRNQADGLGGKGQGQGGVAPEAPQNTTFKTEKTKTHLKAGKILMKWKTREVAPSGNAKLEYAEAIKEVKEGVSEAIIQEQIPPGSQEVVKKYFDSLPAEPKAGDGDAKPSSDGGDSQPPKK